MSYTFAVQPRTIPQFSDVLDGISIAQSSYLDDEEGLLPHGMWRPGGLLLHVPGASTRGVRVTLEAGTFLVRLNLMASPQDWSLALDVVERLARASSGRIEPEDQDAIHVDLFRQRFDAGWIGEQLNLAVEVVMAVVEEQGTAQISGPFREFWIGRRLKSELISEPSDESVEARLIRAAQRVQYVDDSLWYFAAPMVVGDPRGEHRVRVTAFGPEVSYLMPAVEFFAVLPGALGGNHVFVRAESLPHIAGDHFEWLDECQSLVRAISLDAWRDVMARAQEWKVDLFS